MFKRYTEGPDKGRFDMGEWAQPEFRMLRDVMWHWSEKIDGTNIRLVYVPPTDEVPFPRVQIGGRTDNAQLHRDLVTNIEEMLDPWQWGQVFGFKEAVVYGEGYGAGIQKVGGLYRPDKSFIGFDVRVGSTWLEPADCNEVLGKLGLPRVRRYGSMPLHSAIRVFEYGSPNVVFPSAFNQEAFEGVIGRPVGGLLDRFGQRIQTKLKVVDFR